MPVLSARGAASVKGLGFGRASAGTPFTGFNQPVKVLTDYFAVTSMCCAANGTFIAIGRDSSDYPSYITSTDGTTWTSPTAFLANSSMYPQFIQSSSTGVINVLCFISSGTPGTYRFRSTDNGATWSNLVQMDSNVYSQSCSMVTNNAGTWVIYQANSSKGVFRYSTNDGASWTTVSGTSIGYAGGSALKMSWNPGLGKFIGFAFDSINFNPGLLCTSSDGITWTTTNISENNSITYAQPITGTDTSPATVLGVSQIAGSGSTGRIHYTLNGTSGLTGTSGLGGNNSSGICRSDGTYVFVQNETLNNNAFFKWAFSSNGYGTYTAGQYTYNGGAGYSLSFGQNRQIACNAAGKMVLMGVDSSNQYPVVITSK